MEKERVSHRLKKTGQLVSGFSTSKLIYRHIQEEGEERKKEKAKGEDRIDGTRSGRANKMKEKKRAKTI